MKKVFSILILIFLLVQIAKTQTCLPGGINFYTQYQVDNFPSNYPGCTEIIGDVKIGGSVKNVDSLIVLTKLGGNFKIFNTDYLKNVHGLSNLTYIEGYFEVAFADSLTSLAGLDSLKYIGGYLRILDNPLLSDISALSQLSALEYVSIYGCDSLPNLNGLQNLQTVGGIFIKYNALITNLDEFSNITYVDGLSLVNNPLLNDLNGLSNLDSIKYSILIQSNATLTSLDALSNIKKSKNLVIKENPVLSNINGLNDLKITNNIKIIDNDLLTHINDISSTHITGILTIENNPELINIDGLSGLNIINGSIDISNNKKLIDINGLSNLTTCKSQIVIFGCDSLKNIDGFSGLSHIEKGLFLKSNDNLENIDGLSNLSYLMFISISENPLLKNIDGLLNLTSIGGISLNDNPSLTNIDGLKNIANIFSPPNYFRGNIQIGNNDSLTNLDALSNIKAIPRGLAIKSNNLLSNINGLSNITSLGGNLIFVDNDTLTNLDALENITSINGFLEISGNEILTNINGIRNIDPTTILYTSWEDIADLNIFDNPHLSTCAVQAVCDFLGLDDREYNIHDNSDGCNSSNEIFLDCGDYGFSGLVYFDANQNQIKDSLEFGLSNMPIVFEPIGQTKLTNQYGRYYHSGEDGATYSFHLVNDPDWMATSDSSQTIVFDPNSSDNLHFDFGLYPVVPKHKADVTCSSNQTVCNTNVNFYLRYKNTGTYIEVGKIYLNYDSLANFSNATPYPNIVDTLNAQLIWFYDSIFPFQYQDISLELEMPDESSTADTLRFQFAMYRDSADVEVLADITNYTSVVLCAFDPNDKMVIPMGQQEEHYTLHDQELTYTIRFQNTGNASAIDITILDTLDTNLDISTLRITNSSFPVQTTITNNAVEFYFKDIWLPDSTSNESQSHGFLTYKIQPIAGLADYSSIENTAYIIFDSNAAIITNTTYNTMVTTIPVALRELEKTEINMRPNPASNITEISAKNQETIDNILIYNMLGELMLAQKKSIIDVSTFPKGIYFIRVEINEKIGIGKLIVE